MRPFTPARRENHVPNQSIPADLVLLTRCFHCQNRAVETETCHIAIRGSVELLYNSGLLAIVLKRTFVRLPLRGGSPRVQMSVRVHKSYDEEDPEMFGRGEVTRNGSLSSDLRRRTSREALAGAPTRPHRFVTTQDNGLIILRWLPCIL